MNSTELAKMSEEDSIFRPDATQSSPMFITTYIVMSRSGYALTPSAFTSAIDQQLTLTTGWPRGLPPVTFHARSGGKALFAWPLAVASQKVFTESSYRQ